MADSAIVKENAHRQRRVKNWVTAGLLLSMMLTIYGLTLVRLQQGLEAAAVSIEGAP